MSDEDNEKVGANAARLALAIEALLYAHEDDEIPQYTGREIKIALQTIEEIHLMKI